MYNLDLLIGTIVLLIANGASIEENTDLHNISDLALDSIKEAQLAGADVSDLVTNFNTALDLIDKAEHSNFHSCSSYEHCKQQAIGIFVQVTGDAHMVEEQARVTAAVQKMLNLAVYAPIAAFMTSVIGYSIFNAWKSHQVNRLLEMEIKVEKR